LKYIIIGLGHFGASLGEKLELMGNEVIGVDYNPTKIEKIKNKITHALLLDATDITAVNHLPIKDTDVVIIGIGENMRSNIMATTLMKRMEVKRLISRAVSPLQKTILKAMDVTEIINPEDETAERWAKKLNNYPETNSFDLNEDFTIIETEVPEKYYDLTVEEINLRKKYNIILLGTYNLTSEINEIGATKTIPYFHGVASAKTILKKGDKMFLFGFKKNLNKFQNDFTIH